MRDKISYLEEEIKNPEWVSSLKEEVDKVSKFERKFDHILVDINSIRDVIYGWKLKEKESLERHHDKVDPIIFIRAEIESLQLVTRRLELQQAASTCLFTQLSQLQTNYRRLEREMYIQDQEKIEYNSARNKELKAKISQLKEMLITQQAVHQREMEEKLTVGFMTQKEEMDKKMTEFKAALQSLETRTPDHTNPICTEVSKQIEANNRMQAAKFVSIGKFNLTGLDVKNLTTKHKVLVNNTRTYATARIFKHMDRIYTTFVK